MPDNQEISKLKDYVDDKIKQMNQRMEKDFDLIKSKINEIVTEFNKLEDAIKKINGQQKNQPVQSSQVNIEASAEKKSEQQRPFHPKTGNIRNEDVAIDKIFYFGPKR